MSCPICCKTGLRVIREPGVPDLLCCDQCGCEFFFEQAGARIRFSKTPELLEDVLYGEWMTYIEVHKRLQERFPALDGPRARVDVVTLPVRRQKSLAQELEEEALLDLPKNAIDQAMGLYRLGNSIPDIRRVLQRNPKYTEHEIFTTLKNVGHYDAMRKLRSWLTAGLVVVVFLAALGFAVSRGVFPKLIAYIEGTVNKNAALVIPVTGSAAGSAVQPACPATPEAAAQLFGGKSNNWTYQAPRWYYQDVMPADIIVPSGMEATYPSLTRTTIMS